MCNYCDSGTEWECVTDRGGIFVEFRTDNPWNEIHITTGEDANCPDISLEVNYCPWCGEKLRDKLIG